MRTLFAVALITIIPASERPGKRVMVVLDVSGSMEANGKIAAALAVIKTITRQPVDEGYLSAIAFDEGASRYPLGWRKLPDAQAVQGVEDWLCGQLVGGTTRVCPALVKALSEPFDDLFVVLVTDGILHEEGKKQIIACIESMQAKRKAMRLRPAVIAVLGVKHEKPVPVLEAIAKVGRGGYYVTND